MTSYETAQTVLNRISFETFEDARGPITIRAGLILYAKAVLDPWSLRDASVDLLELERYRLEKQIVEQVHTLELEEELNRLRNIEREHFKCKPRILDTYPW